MRSLIENYGYQCTVNRVREMINEVITYFYRTKNEHVVGLCLCCVRYSTRTVIMFHICKFHSIILFLWCGKKMRNISTFTFESVRWVPFLALCITVLKPTLQRRAIFLKYLFIWSVYMLTSSISLYIWLWCMWIWTKIWRLLSPKPTKERGRLKCEKNVIKLMICVTSLIQSTTQIKIYSQTQLIPPVYLRYMWYRMVERQNKQTHTSRFPIYIWLCHMVSIVEEHKSFYKKWIGLAYNRKIDYQNLFYKQKLINQQCIYG